MKEFTYSLQGHNMEWYSKKFYKRGDDQLVVTYVCAIVGDKNAFQGYTTVFDERKDFTLLNMTNPDAFLNQLNSYLEPVLLHRASLLTKQPALKQSKGTVMTPPKQSKQSKGTAMTPLTQPKQFKQSKPPKTLKQRMSSFMKKTG